MAFTFRIFLILFSLSVLEVFRKFLLFWKIFCAILFRGRVLEAVLGLEDILEDTFWSPWLWPRSLKSSKIALSLAREQHYFLNCLNFVDRLKKILEDVFFLEIAWKFSLKTVVFFFRTLALVFLVLGLDLEHSCSWPWACVLDSTSDFNE